MPSPIGHTMVGLCGYLAARPLTAKKHQLPLLLGAIAIANLPDLDMIPGLIFQGDPSAFHRQGTHSFIVAIMVSLLVTLLVQHPKLGRTWWFWWAMGLYGGHIFLDMLVADNLPPMGVQALSPITQQYFIFPLSIFGGFEYYDPELGMIRTILSWQNLVTVMREVINTLPLVGLTFYLTRKRRLV